MSVKLSYSILSPPPPPPPVSPKLPLSPIQFHSSPPTNPTRTPSSSSLFLLTLIPLISSIKNITRICNIKIITFDGRSHLLPPPPNSIPGLPFPYHPPPPPPPLITILHHCYSQPINDGPYGHFIKVVLLQLTFHSLFYYSIIYSCHC